MTPKQSIVHQEALRCAKNFQSSEVALLDILEKVHLEKVYLEFSSSLFDYCVHELKLSEANAYTYSRISKKSESIPALKEEIKKGNITISNAKRILPVLTKENQKIWIQKAEQLSKRELEKEVAKVNPEPVRETVRVIAEDLHRLNLGISSEVLEDLRRAQTLVSQSTQKTSNLEMTLKQILHFYLEHKDPIRKAKRMIERKAKEKKVAKISEEKQSAVAEVAQSKSVQKHTHQLTVLRVGARTYATPSPLSNIPAIPTNRTPLPAATRHQIWSRDHGRCQFVQMNGKTCGSSAFVEIHHKKFVKNGGNNKLNNLQTLCSQHHGYLHGE